jgi:hypothetical protein
MRNALLIGAAVAASGAAPAVAQSNFVASVIGQTIANMNQGAPEKCFDGRWTPSAEDIEKGKIRVASGLDHYRELAAAGTDVSKAFIGSKSFRRWRLDGQNEDPRALRDPWIARAAKLEPVAFTAGNWNSSYHAQWKAVDADGNVLGLYDAWMNKSDTGSRFIWLDLYSPAAADKAMPNVPFCDQPGDIEEWKAANAKREAEKATKRAAKEAAKATPSG